MDTPSNPSEQISIPVQEILSDDDGTLEIGRPGRSRSRPYEKELSRTLPRRPSLLEARAMTVEMAKIEEEIIAANTICIKEIKGVRE